jgi:hypothetical protein
LLNELLSRYFVPHLEFGIAPVEPLLCESYFLFVFKLIKF